MSATASIPTTVLTPDVLSPLVVESADDVDWHDAADVVIVGFGAAGAATALDVRERASRADILIVDRFEGGGASEISGGIVYAGATRHQRRAGFDDTAEEMFKYLSLEVGDAVSEETLRRFCETSNENLEWLEAHGVPFSSAFHDGKTTYPPNGKFLYYSGNEKVDRYAAHARPAPRGHRPVGRSWSGRVLFGALRKAVERSGIRVMQHCPVRRLVVDATATVIGIEVCPIPQSRLARHQSLYRKVNPMRPLQNRRAENAIAKAQLLENDVCERKLIRARTGIVLATGGFIYNAAMLKQFTSPNCADNYLSLIRTGTMGCSGAGIRLGLSVGAATGKMSSVMLGRSIAPPTGLLEGVIVNKSGHRLTNEDTYAGFLGDSICEQPGAEAWLILDSAALRKVLRQLTPTGDNTFFILKLPTLSNLLFGGTRRARTIEDLARRCGIDPTGLKGEIADYNTMASGSSGDPLGKASEYVRPIEAAPFYAINMALSNPLAPTLALTLGGLRVDEHTSKVVRADRSAVAGLYAVGRAAVGVCSNVYFSGMSLADCVFSGRRAGSTLAGILSTTTVAPGDQLANSPGTQTMQMSDRKPQI